MTDVQIKLECLKIALEKAAIGDVDNVISIAQKLYIFVTTDTITEKSTVTE